MKLKEIYEKYKHLDKIICDTTFDDDNISSALRELWQTIKSEVENENSN